MLPLPVRTAVAVLLASAVAACGSGDDDAVAPASGASGASGTDYPKQSIRFLVPYGAGGPTDLTSRTVGSCLEKDLGQTVVVENKPGASGALATTELKGSKPDGYTLSLVTAGTMVLTPLANAVGYTKDDITPIGVMSEVPSLLAVGKASPYKEGKAFLDAARAKSGQLKVGVPGASTPQAIELQRLDKEHGVKVTPVPFNGNAEMTTALLGGNIDAVLINASADVVANVQNGSFLPLAASPEKRLPWLKDTPTFTELGLKGLTLSGSTFGLAGPAGMPAGVTTKLSDTLRGCLEKPEVRKGLGENYVTPNFVNGAELKKVLDETQKVYEPILKK